MEERLSSETPEEADRKAQDFANAAGYFLDTDDASALASYGIHVSAPWGLEALAMVLVDQGFVEEAVYAAIESFERQPNADFLRDFVRVAAPAIQQGIFSDNEQDSAQARGYAETFQALLSGLEESGIRHYAQGKIIEHVEPLEHSGDVMEHYRKGLELGEFRCAVPFSRMLFVADRPDMGFEILKNAWEKYGQREIAFELGRRYHERGDIAEAVRYFHLAPLGKDADRPTPPDCATEWDVASGITHCQSYLAAEELLGRSGYLPAETVRTMRSAILDAFCVLATPKKERDRLGTDLRPMDRLALLQFGAVELSDGDFAAQYLDEICGRLSHSDGQKFLDAFFSQNSSAYAAAFVRRMEVQMLSEMDGEETVVTSYEPEDGEALAAGSDEDYTPSRLYLLAKKHLAFFIYRYRNIGDEELQEKLLRAVRLLEKLVQSAGDLNPLSRAFANMTAEGKPLRQNFFDRSDRFKNWYADLSSSLRDERETSLLRKLSTDAFLLPSEPDPFLELGPREKIFLLVETVLNEAYMEIADFEHLVSEIAGSDISSEDRINLAELLLEFEKLDGLMNVVLAGDIENPELLRPALLAFMYYWDENSFERFLQMVGERLGSSGESLADLLRPIAEKNHSDPALQAVAQGNLAIAYHLADNADAALPIYDRAEAMGDVESGVLAAHLVAFVMKDAAEAESRMERAFANGHFRAMETMVEFCLDVRDTEKAEFLVGICERLESALAEDFRARLSLLKDRPEKLQFLKNIQTSEKEIRRKLPEYLFEEVIEFIQWELSENRGTAWEEAYEGGDPENFLFLSRLLIFIAPTPYAREEAAMDYWESMKDLVENPKCDLDGLEKFFKKRELAPEFKAFIGEFSDIPDFLRKVLGEAHFTDRFFEGSKPERRSEVLAAMAESLKHLPACKGHASEYSEMSQNLVSKKVPLTPGTFVVHKPEPAIH
jgi:hypothetical protein